MQKQLPIALALTALLACSHDPQIRPAPNAMRLVGNESAALALANGVRVSIDTDSWEGKRNAVERVLPTQVTILNNSSRPLRIRYDQFALVGPAGARFAALPPFAIGSVGGSGAAGGTTPELSERQGFYLAKPLEPFYRGLATWPGSFAFDPVYYDQHFGEWPKAPTGEVLRRALPEGVVQAGGRVSGFLYFHELPQGFDRAVFRAELVDANTGSSFGRVGIPLQVND